MTRLMADYPGGCMYDVGPCCYLGTSNDWGHHDNWSTGLVPTKDDEMVFFPLTLSYPHKGSGSASSERSRDI